MIDCHSRSGNVAQYIESKLWKRYASRRHTTRERPVSSGYNVHVQTSFLLLTSRRMQNDMLSWVINEAREDERRSTQALTQRMLTTTFATIRTTTMAGLLAILTFYTLTPELKSFTHALLHLSSRPEEVESIIEQENRPKSSLDKMPKIESYLKGALRSEGIGLGTRDLKSLFTFLE